MTEINKSPMCSTNIKAWTLKDPLLSKVLRYVTHGWSLSTEDEQLIPFFRKKDELSLEDGCILWGSRVVIPPPGRRPLIEELHILE